jgi:hypothetical protein
MMSLVEVVTLDRGSARLTIQTREHCPPHTTCRELAGQWIVRVSFTFVDSSVDLLSIKVHGQPPSTRAVNDLMDAVRRHLPRCRELWWLYQHNNPRLQAEGACCLNNKNFEGGIVTDASYDPGTSRTTIRFQDGAVVVRTV